MNFADGLQTAIKQLQVNIAQQPISLSFLVALQSSRSSVVAMDTFALTLTVSNIPANMTEIAVILEITERYSGVNAGDKIAVKEMSIGGISGGISGNGILNIGNNANVTWNMYALNSTSNVASIYSFGGYISFKADGIQSPYLCFSLSQENRIVLNSTTQQ
jgi:hypothetical protein